MDLQQILETLADTQARALSKARDTIDLITDLDSIRNYWNASLNKTWSTAVEVTSSWPLRLPAGTRPPESPPRSVPAFKRWFRLVYKAYTNHKLVSSLVISLLAIGIANGALRKVFYKSRKRRARKALTGARKQVVVIAGSPTEPITRLVAADLDRRGFIVYITTTSSEEDALVARGSSPDIRAISIKVTEHHGLSDAVTKLRRILDTPVSPFPDARPHKLQLIGIILIPDLYYPSGPVETIPLDAWGDLMYSKVLGPIFLLLNGFLKLIRDHRARFLLLNPCIIGALQLPFHAPEAMTYAALDSFAICLHRETRSQNLKIVQIRMGSFDCKSSRGRSSSSRDLQSSVDSSIRADILSWPEPLRTLYGLPYRSLSRARRPRSTGTDLRVLTRVIFDALTVSNPPRVWRVGQGTCLYRWALALIPECILTRYLSFSGNDQELL